MRHGFYDFLPAKHTIIMETLLKMKTGAPGERIYTADEVASVYDSFGLQPDFVEKLAPRKRRTPAETPGNENERMTFIHQYPAAALDEEDTEEDDDDFDDELDDELDDADLEDDAIADADEPNIDEDDDLVLDDDDDEEEDNIV
jgi:hypothetical protein